MDYREKLDYSSLSTYMNCPREFLFQYVMNLRPIGTSIHLVFGSAWHYGLEVAYNTIKENPTSITPMDATIISVKAFNQLWKLDGEPNFPDEDIIFPKSPGHAANMYKDYWNRFLPLDTRDTEILAVEAPFALNVNTEDEQMVLPNYIGRLDLILTDGNTGISIIDHKTAKALYKTTAQTFEASFQTDGYLTAGRIFYDKIPTITYRMALCQKSKIAFENITINKRSTAIDHFLHNLVHYMKEIIHNLDLLEEDKATCQNRKDILKSFPRKPGYACTSFSTTCAYWDLCFARNNPLLWLERAPQRFRFHAWDPELMEAETKERLAEIN